MKKPLLILSSLLALVGLTNASTGKRPEGGLLIKKEINSGWVFKEAGESKWLPAKVPGTVHTDLLHNKVIEDPYYGDQENKLQWIGEKDWVYQTSFELDANMMARDMVELIFDGLDTYATVSVNGHTVLEANNMFRSWRVDAKQWLHVGSNSIEITFKSAYNEGLKLLKQLPITLVNDNDKGEYKTSVFTRKAQHHYGWDWGARFVTVGIWRPVAIEAWNSVRLEDVHFVQQSQSKRKAQLEVYVTLQSQKEQKAEISLTDAQGKRYSKISVDLQKGVNRKQLAFSITNPKLWWPNGMGDPYLYSFKTSVSVKDGSSSHTNQIGIRTIELVQEKDSIGKSFLFKVNGVPTFMKGANYIPLDHFAPNVDGAKYHKAIAMAKDANMNMLRVWGGGIYENDAFYNECDRQGILVWQDFMFACSFYPWDTDYLNNVREEVRQTVVRLRNHPSVALWCGNNEINEAWHNWGYQKVYRWSKADSAAIWDGYLSLFEKLIPNVIQEEDPSRSYWPSSPSYGWGSPKSLTEGDSHYWGVWWGKQPFEMYEVKMPRFASEYGFQALPSLKTLEEYIPKSELSTTSPTMKVHQKHSIGFDIIDTYLQRDYPEPKNFADRVYLSQLLQGHGIELAIDAHRRNMPRCMGSLYWQFNDCWPVTSWSSMDYKMRPKALHFMAKRAFAPTSVSIARRDKTMEVYVVNDFNATNKGDISYKLYSLAGKLLWSETSPLQLKSNSAALVRTIDKSFLEKFGTASSVVLVVEFGGSKAFGYLTLPKELQLPSPSYHVNVVGSGMDQKLVITASSLVKDLFIECTNGDIELSDNFVDIEPGAKMEIKMHSNKPLSLKDLTFKTLKDIF